MPTRQCKGINGLIVGQQVKLKFVRGLAGFGAGNYFLTHLLYGRSGAGIGAFAAVLGGHFRSGLQTEGYFLVGAHAHMLSFAGYLVLGGVEIVPNQSHRRYDETNYKAEIETHCKEEKGGK